MADAMDIDNSANRQNVSALSTTRAAVLLRHLVLPAKNVTHQSRRLAALRFRAWPFA